MRKLNMFLRKTSRLRSLFQAASHLGNSFQLTSLQSNGLLSCVDESLIEVTFEVIGAVEGGNKEVVGEINPAKIAHCLYLP
jgi:hypothetical protein